jgi:hypothetical protein
MPTSLLQRISASFRASKDDDKTVRMLDHVDHASSSSFQHDDDPSTTSKIASSTVVDASSVAVVMARSRAQDIENLTRKENMFFALFRAPALHVEAVNPRVAKADWGEMNPLFVSKLLVT